MGRVWRHTHCPDTPATVRPLPGADRVQRVPTGRNTRLVGQADGSVRVLLDPNISERADLGCGAARARRTGYSRRTRGRDVCRWGWDIGAHPEALRRHLVAAGLPDGRALVGLHLERGATARAVARRPGCGAAGGGGSNWALRRARRECRSWAAPRRDGGREERERGRKRGPHPVRGAPARAAPFRGRIGHAGRDTPGLHLTHFYGKLVQFNISTCSAAQHRDHCQAVHSPAL